VAALSHTENNSFNTIYPMDVTQKYEVSMLYCCFVCTGRRKKEANEPRDHHLGFTLLDLGNAPYTTADSSADRALSLNLGHR
jgi:hypothetical protein